MRRFATYRSPYPWLALALILAPHSGRVVLWRLALPALYADFRGGLLFLLDAPLTLALVFTLVRLREADFRARLWTAARRLFAWVPLLVWAWLSLAWALSPGLVAVSAGRLGLSLLTALIVVAGIPAERQGLLRALVLGGTLHGFVALLQTVIGGALGWTGIGEIQWEAGDLYNLGLSDFRAYGLTVHPNNLAGYLLAAGIAWAALVAEGGTSRGLLLRILAPTLIGIGILTTVSRAVLLALIVVGPVMVWQLRGRARPSRRMVVIGALVGVVGLVLMWRPLTTRVRLSFTETAAERLTYAFDDTLRVWRDHPVSGAGSGNLMANIAVNGPTLDPALPAHNLYVLLLGELGAVGLLLFGVAVAGTLWRSRGVWTLGLVAIGIVSLFDYYWWLDYRSMWVLFVLVGLAVQHKDDLFYG